MMPQHTWREKKKSYPKHFHDGSDEEIKEGVFGEDPKEILRAFLPIIRAKIHHKRNIEKM